MKQIAASTMKAVRQPVETMSPLMIGESTAPPKPEPDSASATARPRFFTNQFVTTMEMSRRVPAMTTKPSIAKNSMSCHSSLTCENPTSTSAVTTTENPPSTRPGNLSTTPPMTSAPTMDTSVDSELAVL